MAPSPTDTIFAVSSGRPPAAIAVLRISGADAMTAAAALAGSLPAPRRAAVRRLRDADDRTLDRALVLVFPGPASASGEALVELHLHGGRAIVEAVERALIALGLRRAMPGEFTRRALANGRIDLSQAEGLADLLAAETETQRRAAVEQAEGAVSRAVGDWSARLLMLAARVEAQIDFADEDDVAADAAALTALASEADAIAAEMANILAQPPVERLRDGIRVVLAGPPNSGKSTLLNALAERPVAIATPIPGTTRDRLEAPVVREGVAYLLTDTAGLTETDDVVEAIGVARAGEAIAAADIVIWLGDDPGPAGALRVWARADLPGRERPPQIVDAIVSAPLGRGVQELWALLARQAVALLPSEDRLTLNQRQRGHVAEAHRELTNIQMKDPIVVAEQLRNARTALDRVSGALATEAMLDALFGRFCVGK